MVTIDREEEGEEEYIVHNYICLLIPSPELNPDFVNVNGLVWEKNYRKHPYFISENQLLPLDFKNDKTILHGDNHM